MFAPQTLEQSDPEICSAIRQEARRQEDHVELIASENYASPAVLAAQGSLLTNKYAEGYPGRRYYGGCEYVDIAETIAIARAKQLFGAPWANVQARDGHFVLTDLSSNGTFLLVDEHSSEVVLRREEAVLGGRGWIGLGKNATKHGDHSVRFTLQPESA